MTTEPISRKYSVTFIKESIERQRNYKLHPTISSIIHSDRSVSRYTIIRNNRLLQVIPRETSNHEIKWLASILQGIVKKLEFDVIYAVASQESVGPKEYDIIGEITGIPAIVVNNEIMAIFPEFAGENKLIFEDIRAAAKALGGDTDSLLVTAYYKFKTDKIVNGNPETEIQ